MDMDFDGWEHLIVALILIAIIAILLFVQQQVIANILCKMDAFARLVANSLNKFALSAKLSV